MEKLILIYCLFIALLLFGIVLLLLKEEEQPHEDEISGTNKWLLALCSPIVLMVLHLNMLLLPWQREHRGDVVAFSILTIVVLFCALPLLYLLFTTFISSRSHHHHRPKVKEWA